MAPSLREMIHLQGFKSISSDAIINRYGTHQAWMTPGIHPRTHNRMLIQKSAKHK